jgi:hypothetical protein
MNLATLIPEWNTISTYPYWSRLFQGWSVLPSLGVRRLSVNFFIFYNWAKWNQTWQKASI